MKWTAAATLGIALAALAGLAGCTNASEDEEQPSANVEQGTIAGDRGLKLFFFEDFGGNGRTCGTCHGPKTGTINPAEVAARLKYNPRDPLFRHDGADTIGGKTFERIKTHATIIVEVPLPANVSIPGSNARKVQLNRGVPTTMNIALEKVFMADGREPTLASQAKNAIFGHAQSTKVSDRDIADIVSFEKTLFNRRALQDFSKGRPPPTLPQGITEAQKRGRVFFADDNLEVQNGTAFRCVFCHAGPMLNETSQNFQNLIGLPAGFRFFDIATNLVNATNDPVLNFDFKMPDGSVQRVTTTDPGLALVTGDPSHANQFKIPTIWGAKDTAPYFHNNGAKNLKELVGHYQTVAPLLDPVFAFTDAHAADMVAYLELL